MRSKLMKTLVVIPFLIIGLVGLAHADLNAVGRVGPNGFPNFYRDLPVADIDSTALRICLDRVNCDFSRPVAGNAASQNAGFNTAWYYHIETKAGPVNNHFGEFVAGVRATFAGSTPATTVRRTFNHIRIDLRRLPVQGRYVVDHPFGRQVFNTVIDDGKGTFEVNFFRQSRGPNFKAALAGPVGPFVRGLNPPAGFIGTHAQDQRITGAVFPGRNFFRITGPANAILGGPVNKPNVLTQPNFRIMGQMLP